MTRKAIIVAIIVSLLTAVAGTLTLSAKSTGTGSTSLLVSPNEIIGHYPAVGEAFTVNVNVSNANYPNDSQGYPIDPNIFGFEFKLSWDPSVLSCASANAMPPTNWSGSYIIPRNQINNTIGQYWVAAAAIPGVNVTPFNGNASLARLTFQVIHDPPYPGSISSPMNLTDTMLTDVNASAIDHTDYNSTYECSSSKAVIEWLPHFDNFMNPYTSGCGSALLQVDIMVFNVSDLAHFRVYLGYNATLLTASVPEIGTIFPNPYLNVTYVYPDFVEISADSAYPVSGSGLLGTVNFTSSFPELNESCDLTLLSMGNFSTVLGNFSTVLKTSKGMQIQYDTIDGLMPYLDPQPDINHDGKVDGKDISSVAYSYGSQPCYPRWNPLCDLNHDTKTNLYDLAIVCKYFGKDWHY